MIIFMLALVLVVLPSKGQEIVYPSDAGVIDVTQAPYNADPTGTVDATVAIQTALNDYPNDNRVIYLPTGTYLISDRLDWPAGGGGNNQKRTILQGLHRDSTRILLQANHPDYQTPTSRKAMIYMGGSPAQRFGNDLRDITIDVNRDNPGAVGVQFMGNNWSRINRVKIVSQDSQGVAGLDLFHSDEIGPALITDLEIEGFYFGIRSNWDVNSITFEDIYLHGQTNWGIYNRAQHLNIRKLHSENSVTALFNEKNSNGSYVIMDSEFTGVDTASNHPAIHNQKMLYIRNSIFSGYALAIDNDDKGRECTDVDTSYVYEHNAHCIWEKLFACARDTSLHLPIKERPKEPFADTSLWVNIEDFGAIGDDGIDDAPALQAAINSGANTIYIPSSDNYLINSDVYIFGPTKRIIGTRGQLSGTGTFHFVDSMSSDAPLFFFENIYIPVSSSITISHESTRTLVVQDCADIALEGNGPGDFFINNVAGGPLRMNHRNQSIWARQLNIESPITKIINNGARFWCFGYKSEKKSTIMETYDGGASEMIGGFIYSNEGLKDQPMFVVDESNVSLMGIKETYFSTYKFQDWVIETNGGIRDTFTNADLASSGIFSYSGGCLTTLNLNNTLLDFKLHAQENALLLTWTMRSFEGIGTYFLQRKEEGQHFQSIKEYHKYNGGELIGNSYLEQEVGPGKPYSYRMLIVDLQGDTSYSPIRSGALNVQISEVLLYPNPASSLLYIETTKDTKVQNVVVWNALGQKVYQNHNIDHVDETIQLPIAGWPQGKYVVELRNKESCYRKSFIKY